MQKFYKFYSILEYKQKQLFFYLLILMIIGMLLELLSFGLIIPAVNILLQYNETNYPFIEDIINYLPDSFTSIHFFVLGLSILVFVYLVKAIFLSFLSWFTMHFVYFLQQSLSFRLFRGYLYKPYNFYLDSNSSQLIKNTTFECGNLSNVVLAASYLIAELLVVIGMSVLLIYYQPTAAISVIIFLGILSIVFYLNIRNFNLKWGREREYFENNRIKRIQQGIGAIQEVKVLNREEDFLKLYSHENTGLARVSKLQNFIIALPRFYLELAGVMGLSLLIIILVLNGTPNASIITTLAIFGAAAFRIIPSINRSISALSQIRYYTPSINIIYEQLKDLNSQEYIISNQKKLTFKNLIKICDLSFKYNNSSDLPTITDLDLEIKKGQLIGIGGKSGSGKSTFINLFLGLLEPSKGSIIVDGINIKDNLHSWRNNIGFVPQNIYLIDDTIRRNISLGVPDEDVEEDKIRSALELSQLDEFIPLLENGLDTIVGERGIRLSGGQLQRVGIARALYHNPDVLVLDEATNSLDYKTEEMVLSSLRKLQGTKTIILISHRKNTLEFCDKIVTFSSGKISIS